MAASEEGPVAAALGRMLADGTLTPDAGQLSAAAALDRLDSKLFASRRRGPLPLLFRKPESVRGLYLVGEVGRGKTLLMDLFFAGTAESKKRRLHFHEFMDEIHAAIAAFRASPRGRNQNADPVAAAVAEVLGETRLLCLDEFQVSDITNAMLLGRLFEKLFSGGLVLVATSNVEPHNLYRNGLNRQLFLPFIALLERQTEIVRLDGAIDYRRLKFEGQAVYHFGIGPEAKEAMDRLWLRLTGGVPGEPAEIVSLGRRIPVPLAAMGAARFPFAALCEAPLGARDYLKLAHAYDALVIDGVPRFDRVRSNFAKRFILLVDTLYDRGVKLAASFAAPLDQLGEDDVTRFEFQRTVSRLVEMQSSEYLAAPRRQSAREDETAALETPAS